jgi:hypothetical protein
MPDGLRVQYVLGPCDARTEYRTRDQLRAGSVACGGGVYYVRAGTANPVFLDYAPTVEKAAESNAKYDPKALFISWNALMRTLAYTLPDEIKRTRAAVQRLRRAVR